MGYDETIRDFKLLLARGQNQEEEEEDISREEKNTGESSDIWDEVRSIALDYVDVNIKRPWESYNKACLIRSFPNLDEISLVIRSAESSATAVQRLEDVMEPQKSEKLYEDRIEFAQPKDNPEMLLRWWAGFRHSFAMEEKMLENALTVNGKPYKQFRLPVVNLVTKC